MSAYKVILFIFVIWSASFLQLAESQYWFQFGAKAGSDSWNNNGASAQIQTVVTPNLSSGSLAFWVGENLQNGAFIQIGYIVENKSGYYPSLCTISACTGYQNLSSSQAEWFYEYFPAGISTTTFLGRIGPAGSAGSNYTFNNYGFYSSGNKWYFLFNNAVIGSADMGTNTSGFNGPIAFGELANASYPANIRKAILANLSVYKNGRFIPASNGYSSIGYGAGSSKTIKNPYGVQELDNRINYFAAGSNITQLANGAQLWSSGYTLSVSSQYGNLNKSVQYAANAKALLSAPQIIQISKNIRVVFAGWYGTGFGSYTGALNSTALFLYSNVTEYAAWKVQYFVNVTSQYGIANGTGWYAPNSTATYSVSQNVIYQNSTARVIFSGWNTGVGSANNTVKVNSPINEKAVWIQQYYLNLSSDYGNTAGKGWYINNTMARFSATDPIINISSTKRISFYSWPNGNRNASTSILISRPVLLHAAYKVQYLIKLQGTDAYGKQIAVKQFYINGNQTAPSSFLYSGISYKVTGAYYKGTLMNASFLLNISSSTTINIQLPVYSVTIITSDILGSPVNATAALSFSNGTDGQLYSGRSGAIRINDTPYGSVSGYVKYLGISIPIEQANGGTVKLLFISPEALTIIIAVVIIIAIAIHELTSRHIKRTSTNTQPTEKNNKDS